MASTIVCEPAENIRARAVRLAPGEQGVAYDLVRSRASVAGTRPSLG
jgi:hypothetical protein